MSVERIEITEQGPYAEGQVFGDAGPFELIRARLRYAVNPMLEDHQRITDLECANRGTDGCVRFSGDLVLIRPQDPSSGNGALVIDVPNRGRSLLPGALNRTPAELSVSDPQHPGDGFLFRQGFSVASVAWQWNAPDIETLLQFQAPEALGLDGNSIPGEAITDLRPSKQYASMPIEHLGQPGYPVSRDAAESARLYVREYEDDEPSEIPHDRWRFARQTDDGVVPSTRDLWIEGGFTPGRIYEIVYSTDRSPVVGTGLLAFRDAALFLRSWQRSYDRVHGFGISQSGRFLRHLLYLGLNRNPDDLTQRAFDGVHIHVAGGIRGEFNRRYGQPSQLFLAGPIHEFPFADVERDEPLTGDRDGLLKRSDEQGVTPKVVKTNTSWEFWRGDASLIDIDPATDEDIPQHPQSRHYLLACTQHGPWTSRASGQLLPDRRAQHVSAQCRRSDAADARGAGQSRSLGRRRVGAAAVKRPELRKRHSRQAERCTGKAQGSRDNSRRRPAVASANGRLDIAAGHRGRRVPGLCLGCR